MLQEHIFYEDSKNGIKISSTRIVVKAKVFSASHFVSYELSEEDIKPPTSALLITIAGTILGFAINNSTILTASLIVLALTLFYWGFSYLRRSKGVAMTFSSGEEIILDENIFNYVSIKEALNELMIFRG